MNRGGVVFRFVTGQDFLGAFSQTEKTLVTFIMSVRPSFCPHVTTRPTVRIFVKFGILFTVKILICVCPCIVAYA